MTGRRRLGRKEYKQQRGEEKESERMKIKEKVKRTGIEREGGKRD